MPASNLWVPFSKTCDPKTAYFGVILRQHCDLGTNIFGTNGAIDKKDFKTMKVLYIFAKFEVKATIILWT